MFSELADSGLFFWWQLIPLAGLLVVMLIVNPLLLWVGAKYVAKLPETSFARCLGAHFAGSAVGGIAMAGAGIIAPPVGWVGGVLVYILMVKAILRTTFGKAALAWLPVIPGLVLAVVALVAVLVPTLGQARELARQQVCRSNLAGLGTAIRANASSGKPATTMEELVRNGLITDALLRCPSVKSGPSYFIMLPPRDAPQNALVACDIAGTHPDIRNVLLLDGSVQRMNQTEFAAELAKACNQRFAAELKVVEARLATLASPDAPAR
jgi:hypothetical protein